MDSVLQNTCETFIKNRDLLKDNFRHEGMVMHLMGAAVMTAAGEALNIMKYKKCEDFIDSRAGVFSSLRGILKVPMVINMAMSKDPEVYFDKVQQVYADIYESRGVKDERLFLAAMIIASKAQSYDEISDLIEIAGKIYDRTDAAGRLFADMSAYVTAASVAARGVNDVSAFAEDMEFCKEELNQPAEIGRVPEELCMLLAAQEGDAKEKCDRVKEISAALGARKIGLGSGDAASMLAALACLDMTAEEIADAVDDADGYLKEQKGFGFMGTGAAMRHMYAAMMVCIAYSDESNAGDIGGGAAISDAIRNRYTASMLLSQQIMLQTQMMSISNLHLE